MLLLLPVLACSNIDERSWGGGGGRYTTGEMFSPVDTSDSGDTADTGDTSAPAGAFSATGTPSCAFEDNPNVGWVIACTATFSEDDAALLDGGSVYITVVDQDGVGTAASLDIATTADGTAIALLDDSTVSFSLGDVDEDASYTIYMIFENTNLEQSDEYSSTVTPS